MSFLLLKMKYHTLPKFIYLIKKDRIYSPKKCIISISYIHIHEKDMISISISAKRIYIRIYIQMHIRSLIPWSRLAWVNVGRLGLHTPNLKTSGWGIIPPKMSSFGSKMRVRQLPKVLFSTVWSGFWVTSLKSIFQGDHTQLRGYFFLDN